MSSNPPLYPDPNGEENNFILAQNAGGVWITVGPISVHLVPTDEGVVVDMYPQGREMENALGGCWATYAEAEEVEASPEQEH